MTPRATPRDAIGALETLHGNGMVTDRDIERIKHGDPARTLEATRALIQDVAEKATDGYFRSLAEWQLARLAVADGDDPSPMVEAANASKRQQLDKRLHELQGAVERVKVRTTPGLNCEACHAGNGAAFTIEEAIERAPLPHDGCTCELDGLEGWCRCLYVSVRDAADAEQ